ncbi:hypothetical protein WCX49_00355 [Sulfurimonas sp. HSL-1656]|uniref:hypothetical protein n=1 Tax=Thiomicrolovo subterrani TaxID=3131934 RepID=UPI0031F8404F
MKRLLFGTALLAAALYAAPAERDSDLDGVPDTLDRCPGTAFDMTVGADGCAPDEGTAVTFLAGIGMSYATGKYGGTESVDSLSTDAMAALYIGDFYVTGIVSYYHYGTADPTVADSEDGGLSDTFLGAGYAFGITENLFVTPGVHLKLATAETGTGTGENDWGGSVVGLYRFAALDVFAQYGYTVTGDSSTTEYPDIAFGSAGVTFYPTPTSSLSFSYDYSESYIPESPDLSSVSVLGIFPLYDTLSLKVNYSLGLSDSASDHAAGIMIFARF